MPRYFLHLKDGEDLYVDEVGCSAVDEYEVLYAFVEVLREYRYRQVSLSRFNLSITDAAGDTVVRLSW